MKKKKPTAGERMIASAKQALAFAKGEKNHGCVVHIPEDIDVRAIRKKMAMSQSEKRLLTPFDPSEFGVTGFPIIC